MLADKLDYALAQAKNGISIITLCIICIFLIVLLMEIFRRRY